MFIKACQWAHAPAFERGNVATVVLVQFSVFSFSSELKLQLLRYHARKLAHAPIGTSARSHESLRYLHKGIWSLTAEEGLSCTRVDSNMKNHNCGSDARDYRIWLHFRKLSVACALV